MQRDLVTKERLDELFHVDVEKGILTRKISIKGYGGQAGRVAGYTRPNGYKDVQIDTKRYLIHRLIWFYVHGTWPKEQIDHIDQDRSNNSIHNLREVTNGQNQINSLRHSKYGRGVNAINEGRQFAARLFKEGKHIHIGCFSTAEEAEQAYFDAATKQYGEYFPINNYQEKRIINQ